MAWVEANKIGKTVRSWEEEEAAARKLHAELSAMKDEKRDVAVLEGHAKNVAMLNAVLSHLDSVVIPAAKAKEAAAKAKRKKKRARHA